MTYTLIIDCPPGNPRPDDILRDILVDLTLKYEDFEKLYSLFGEWGFRTAKTPTEDDKKAIAARLTSAYNCGQIRYAEW